MVTTDIFPLTGIFISLFNFKVSCFFEGEMKISFFSIFAKKMHLHLTLLRVGDSRGKSNAHLNGAFMNI